MRKLGARIKHLRERKCLTQAALAERAGLSPIFIRKMEAGERLPSMASLKRLARALGVRVVVDLVE